MAECADRGKKVDINIEIVYNQKGIDKQGDVYVRISNTNNNL